MRGERGVRRSRHRHGDAPRAELQSGGTARQVLSPLDLEPRFGMVDGDIFHGALSLDQLFSARPRLGYANYRMPLDGLYLCGSGAHPGGGVTGVPGITRRARSQKI